mmetsp:Transcript_37995/g.70671  ORF Transcript_37995/g.70671 Transcript_37995/m.70671 type:complete len:1002 (-) Transcript_37995:31-3036(-)
MAPGGQLWKVVGGSQQGGIIVRTGRGLNTPKEPARLSTGAVIEQQECVDERLRYRKLKGDGPESGWVSIRLNDRDLLVRLAEGDLGETTQEPPNPTVEQASDTVAAAEAGKAEPEEPEVSLASTDGRPMSIELEARESSGERVISSSLEAEVFQAAECQLEASPDTKKPDLEKPESEETANVAQYAAEKPKLQETGVSKDSSSCARADRVNRGNYWFDFEDMSSDAGSEREEAEPESHLSVSAVPGTSAADSQSPLSPSANGAAAEGTVPLPERDDHEAMAKAKEAAVANAKEAAERKKEKEADAKEAAEREKEMAQRLEWATDLAGRVEPLLDEPVLCSDSNGVPRGRCQSSGCKALLLDLRTYLCWVGGPIDREGFEEKPTYKLGDKVEVRDKLGDEWIPGVVVASHPSVLVRPDHWHAHQRSWPHMRPKRVAAEKWTGPVLPEHCQRCGCAVGDHELLQAWHSKVEASLKRFRNTGKNTKRELPRRSRVPLAALDWSPDDVAVFVLTAGVFDPRRDGRCPSPVEGPSDAKLLVSVITPTSQKRHPFHPLLYKSFCDQTYEQKELVVVDTGDEPSAFFQERARDDPRIIYRWFNVKDARQQNLAECLVEGPEANQGKGDWGKGGWGRGAGWQHAYWSKPGMWYKNPPPRKPSHLQGKVRGGARVEGWTLGMKRNLACHLARGSIIAHFDDDDLYASCYLEIMASKLCHTLGHDGTCVKSRELIAGAATLQDWHVFDFVDQTFGFVAPLSDTLLEHHMRQSFAYGFGFTYIYSRAAWEMVMFADVEWSEDGHFTEDLMNHGRPVKLIQSSSVKTQTDALAAHSHHRDTTSGGEFVDYQINGDYGRRPIQRSVRMGQKVEPPQSLQSLLPLVTEIIQAAGLRKGEIHPLRKQLSELPVGAEVGLAEKQNFMKSDVGKEISSAAAIARRPNLANNLNQFRQWRPPQAGGWPTSPAKGGGKGVPGIPPWAQKSAGWKGAGAGRGGNSSYFGNKGGHVNPWRRY